MNWTVEKVKQSKKSGGGGGGGGGGGSNYDSFLLYEK